MTSERVLVRVDYPLGVFLGEDCTRQWLLRDGTESPLAYLGAVSEDDSAGQWHYFCPIHNQRLHIRWTKACPGQRHLGRGIHEVSIDEAADIIRSRKGALITEGEDEPPPTPAYRKAIEAYGVDLDFMRRVAQAKPATNASPRPLPDSLRDAGLSAKDLDDMRRAIKKPNRPSG